MTVPFLTAVCDHCRRRFLSAWNSASKAGIIDCGETCPFCGALARTDNQYVDDQGNRFIDRARLALSDESVTEDQLRSLLGVVGSAKDDAPIEHLKAAAEAINPNFGQLFAGDFRSSFLYPLLIALIMYALQQCTQKDAVTINNIIINQPTVEQLQSPPDTERDNSRDERSPQIDRITDA